MKLIRRLFSFIVFLVAILVIAILVSPFWLGPAIRAAVNAFAPAYVGTDVALGECGVNIYGGSVHLGAFALANPTPFTPKDCVKIGSFDVTVDPGSLMTDVVRIREIALRDTFVSVAFAGKRNNFSAIGENVRRKTGDRAADPETEAGAVESKPAVADTNATEPKPAVAEEESAAPRKVIIERLEISGVTVSVSGLPIPLPTIVLTDIGRSEGGVTWETACERILTYLRKKAGVDELLTLGKGGLNKGLQELGKAGMRSLETMDPNQLKAAGETFRTQGREFGNALKEKGVNLGDSFKTTGKDLGASLKTTGKDLGNTLKEAVGNGESAKKAGQALLKGLFGN